MTIDSLRVVRNILLRSALISFGIVLFSYAVTFGCWDCWLGMANKMYHMDETQMRWLMLGFFTEVKFFVLFVLLTPALAIHWTIKKEIAKG